MKKILFILFCYLLGSIPIIHAQYNTSSCDAVTGEAIPLDPQPTSGNYDYYGVKVTLNNVPASQVTVQGYIHHDASAPNTGAQFLLVLNPGQITAQTDLSFFQITRWNNAVVTITSVSPCPYDIMVTYAGVPITYEPNGCILKFNSLADVNTVINQLNADYDSYNDDYDSQYPNLTEDQLDDMDEQNGFDEFQKFKDFEAMFGGFCSKRAEIESVENTWLANSFTGTDPDDIDLTFDDAENTIFNNNYSFKVGNDVYQLTSTGIYKNGILQDNGGNTSILNSNNMILVQENLNARNHNSGPMFSMNNFNLSSEIYWGHTNMNMPIMTDCKSNKKKKETVVTNNNRRIDLKISINSFWAFSSVKAKAVSFKKKNGNWKRARTNMGVGCGGTVYEGDCNGSFPFTTRKPSSGYYKRKHLKSPYRSQGVPGTETNWKTYTGLLAGTIDAPDINVAGTVILTFL